MTAPVTLSSSPELQSNAKANPGAGSNTYLCAVKALACLAAVVYAATNLPLLVTAVALAGGVASGYVLKESTCPVYSTGAEITNGDLGRHVATVALSYFLPSFALYSLAATALSFGNVLGRQIKV